MSREVTYKEVQVNTLKSILIISTSLFSTKISLVVSVSNTSYNEKTL